MLQASTLLVLYSAVFLRVHFGKSCRLAIVAALRPKPPQQIVPLASLPVAQL